MVTVEDDGHGINGTADGGHGLRGIRERAELYGGTLEVGRRDPARHAAYMLDCPLVGHP